MLSGTSDANASNSFALRRGEIPEACTGSDHGTSQVRIPVTGGLHRTRPHR